MKSLPDRHKIERKKNNELDEMKVFIYPSTETRVIVDDTFVRLRLFFDRNIFMQERGNRSSLC